MNLKDITEIHGKKRCAQQAGKGDTKMKLGGKEKYHLRIALSTAMDSERELINCNTPSFVEPDEVMLDSIAHSKELIKAYSALYKKLTDAERRK